MEKKLCKRKKKKNKFKKGKQLSEEVLQIAEKKRDAKSQGEKERCTYLNT